MTAIVKRCTIALMEEAFKGRRGEDDVVDVEHPVRSGLLRPVRMRRRRAGRGPRRTTMTNGILRFNTNSPVEVALRWDNGKRVEGRYGEQVMYSLEGDRVM